MVMHLLLSPACYASMLCVIQNKVFVYRGKEYERLSDFAAGLQNQFPNALVSYPAHMLVKLLSSLACSLDGNA